MNLIIGFFLGYLFYALEVGSLSNIKWAGLLAIILSGLRAFSSIFSLYRAANSLDNGRANTLLNAWIKRLELPVQHYISSHTGRSYRCQECQIIK